MFSTVLTTITTIWRPGLRQSIKIRYISFEAIVLKLNVRCYKYRGCRIVSGGIKKRAAKSENFLRAGMQGKSRVSSAIKYDCLKLDDSGSCIIRKTWPHCI